MALRGKDGQVEYVRDYTVERAVDDIGFMVEETDEGVVRYRMQVVASDGCSSAMGRRCIACRPGTAPP
ncbi:hypothetical protein [Actinacidiphila glaucinigra]|uniref:Uncharacterized protein n=1 Tax=Actinacidiphila glaucinigra TaxID=235986 RepID=A0A239LV63_9ACTN|nr:hypothetical protein [Actinacidiphila glaucinigra]SNT34567.1 hypothetical protein SAMN05216252_121133 [Actinacidiphila glaucinigra]